MKKTILLFMLATSLFAFSANKTSKKSRRTKKARTMSDYFGTTETGRNPSFLENSY